MNYLTLFITVPLTLFAIIFAVSNTSDVAVSALFIDGEFKIPLYLLGLGMLGGGFFCGALFVWILSQKTRYKCWKETRRAERLEKELDALRPTQV
jgi:uncharacterized membrane protein YciS (DUF1049 family)